MTQPTTLPINTVRLPLNDKPSIEPVEHPDRTPNERLPHPTARLVISSRRVRVRVSRTGAPC